MSNYISEDFPLYYSPKIPVFHSKTIPRGKKKIPSNIYTNEHPDFFKLDYMKEQGYRNPYLSEVIKVDRSEQFKKIESNVERIGLINFIKSNRKYSQDPKILKYIQNEFDIEMNNKRQRVKQEREEKNKNKDDSKKYLSTEPNDSDYIKYIKKLNNFSPKMTFHVRKYIDTRDNIPLGKFNISKENFNKIKKIKCVIEPQKSSYIGNCNDYTIAEAQNRNKNKEFNHERKSYLKTSLLSGLREKIDLPPQRNDRWGSFYENYLLLMNKSNGFRKKGGLFTEFSNKNIEVINVNKRDIREKLLKQKKKKLYNTTDNSLINNKSDNIFFK